MNGEIFYDIFWASYRRSQSAIGEMWKFVMIDLWEFYTISDYLLCRNKFTATVYDLWYLLVPISLHLSHLAELSFWNYKRFVSHGPQLLNMLLWNYNPEQLNSQQETMYDDKISLILIYFPFLRGADKFLFEDYEQFISFALDEWRKSLKRFLQCSQNPLIIDSESLSYLLAFARDPSSAFVW